MNIKLMQQGYDYYSLAVSMAFSLRKVKGIFLHQDGKINKIRAQNHVMVVLPFGMGKSTQLKQALGNKQFEKKVFPVDTLTKASLLGTVDKMGKYLMPLYCQCAGQVMTIDEWNSLDEWTQNSFLSILESQESNKSLGFQVNTPIKVKMKKKTFYELDVEKGNLRGKSYFSCIINAMYFEIERKNKQDMSALLSRFMPVYIKPDMSMVENIISGKFMLNVNDVSGEVLQVDISEACLEAIRPLYLNYVKPFYPEESDEYGFITRAYSMFIRMGVFNYMRQVDNQKQKLLIDEPGYFAEMLPYVAQLMRNFARLDQKGTEDRFKDYVYYTDEKIISMIDLEDMATYFSISKKKVMVWLSEMSKSCINAKKMFDKFKEQYADLIVTESKEIKI